MKIKVGELKILVREALAGAKKKPPTGDGGLILQKKKK